MQNSEGHIRLLPIPCSTPTHSASFFSNQVTMALHLSIAPLIPRSSSFSTELRLPTPSTQILRPSSGARLKASVRRTTIVGCAGPIAETVVGKVTEVDKDTFWPIVEAAGDKPVVLDMYTQWCGPCKVMAPKFKELSEKYLDVVFLKLNCNQENKPLAKELGIRVVPTFKILKERKIVKEITGSKFDELVFAIDSVRSSENGTP